mmetsp:Transcript_10473/g.31996  ORF Transcript_10473/g.31996 Transcript_10473/m.31996 type:complete len:129 (+) Transcript_10473:482-868(+)
MSEQVAAGDAGARTRDSPAASEGYGRGPKNSFDDIQYLGERLDELSRGIQQVIDGSVQKTQDTDVSHHSQTGLKAEFVEEMQRASEHLQQVVFSMFSDKLQTIRDQMQALEQVRQARTTLRTRLYDLQ